MFKMPSSRICFIERHVYDFMVLLLVMVPLEVFVEGKYLNYSVVSMRYCHHGISR